MMLKTISLLLCCLLWQGTQAQTIPQAKALKALRATYQHLSKQTFPKNANLQHHLQYRLEQETWEQAQTQQIVDVVLLKDQIQVKTPQMSFYHDYEQKVSIYPEQAYIVLAASDLEQSQGRLPAIGFELQDSLLAIGAIQAQYTPSKQYQVSVRLSESQQVLWEVAAVTYVFDPKAKRVLSISIEYPKEHPLKATRLIFEQYQYNQALAEAPQSALEMVYTAQGALKAAYKSYQVIDLRTTHPH